MRERVLAVLVSDIHLSHAPPVARSAEKDWYAAMARPLKQIADLATSHDAIVVAAGDIFDRWNPPPELINFAIENLPEMYAVPGQHDLPNHSAQEIHRSAFWTLVMSKNIYPLTPGKPLEIGRLVLHGFPWGAPPEPIDRSQWPAGDVHLAVVHAYIWKDGFGYVGADENKRVSKYRAALQGYSAAVFGDNHKGFMTHILKDNFYLLNAGTMMKRWVDELHYEPHVGLLYADGRIERVPLDTSQDLFIPEAYEEAENLKLAASEALQLDTSASRFVEMLRGMSGDWFDFRSAICRRLDGLGVADGVRKKVMGAMDGK